MSRVSLICGKLFPGLFLPVDFIYVCCRQSRWLSRGIRCAIGPVGDWLVGCCGFNGYIIPSAGEQEKDVCDFMFFSTVLQSHQDDGQMIMKGGVQRNPVNG